MYMDLSKLKGPTKVELMTSLIMAFAWQKKPPLSAKEAISAYRSRHRRSDELHVFDKTEKFPAYSQIPFSSHIDLKISRATSFMHVVSNGVQVPLFASKAL